MFSVLLPVFNCAEKISFTLNNILNQSLKNFELVIVDDGSTDNTLKVIESFSKIDKRIKIISKHHSGLIDSLNIGLEKCDYDLIIRHDAEDLSHINRFEFLVSMMNSYSEISCIATRCFLLDENYKIIGLYPFKWQKNLNRAIEVDHFSIAHPSVIFRKKDVLAVGGYPDALHCEDYALWVKLRENGYNFMYYNKPLYAYILSTKGITYENLYEQINNMYKVKNKQVYPGIIQKHIIKSRIKNKIVFNVNNKMTYSDLSIFYYFLQRYYNQYLLLKYNSYKKGYTIKYE